LVERTSLRAKVAPDVEQDAAACDPPPREDVNAQFASVTRHDLLVADAVVPAVLRMTNVAQAVSLARGLRPEVVQVIVAPIAAFADDRLLDAAAAVQRWVRPVDPQVEREDCALPD
jgi:hypothetical protein